MERTAVNSTVIATVGYSPDARILEVEFQTGRVYHYFEVPPTVHRRLMTAESAGRYFNAAIRDKYRSEELPREP